MNELHERIKFKLKDRKKKLREKLFSFRFSRIQPQQNKILNCFAPEEHKINEMDIDVNPKAEGEKEVEIGDKRYAKQMSPCISKGDPKNIEENAGHAVLPVISKKNAQKSFAFFVENGES